MADLAVRTKARYEHAMKAFLTWRGVGASLGALDGDVCDWAIALCNAGCGRRGLRQLVVDARCGFRRVFGLRAQSWPLTDGALHTWDRIRPAISAPPVPERLLWAVLAVAQELYGPATVALLTLAYLGMLRASEVVQLTPRDVGLRRTDAGTLVGELALRKTKTGPEQLVTLTHQRALWAVQWIRSHCRGTIVAGCSYYALSRRFRNCLERLGVKVPHFTLHSLRHGGACYYYREGEPPETIRRRGRWRRERSFLTYLQTGRARLLGMQLPHIVLVWSRMMDDFFEENVI